MGWWSRLLNPLLDAAFGQPERRSSPARRGSPPRRGRIDWLVDDPPLRSPKRRRIIRLQEPEWIAEETSGSNIAYRENSRSLRSLSERPASSSKRRLDGPALTSPKRKTVLRLEEPERSERRLRSLEDSAEPSEMLTSSSKQLEARDDVQQSSQYHVTADDSGRRPSDPVVIDDAERPKSSVSEEVLEIILREEDRKILTDSQSWLNDRIINMLFSKLGGISDMMNGPNTGPVHCLNSFFYTKLTAPPGYSYASLRKWTKKINFKRNSEILLPIHQGAHWMFAWIEIATYCIRVADPLGNYDTCRQIGQNLLKWIKDECRFGKLMQLELDPLRWKVKILTETPKQNNSWDCGAFVCEFALRAARFHAEPVLADPVDPIATRCEIAEIVLA